MKAILMMGGPGSGKSYVRESLYSEIEAIDSDAIKSAHPDYDPDNPSALHAWSSREANKRLHQAIDAGQDFVYDGTGKAAEKYVQIIQAAHEAGYETLLVYVACNLSTALERNRNRDRKVPEDLVVEFHSRVATSFEIVARYAGGVRVVNND